MGRPENPIDPQDGPVQRFAYELRKLREEAGAPAYRAMARHAGYSAATLSQAAAGERLPTLPVVLAYVRACGGDGEEWRYRWKQTDDELARLPRPQEDDTESPYRGMSRFEPADAELFFGRDQLICDLLQLARQNRVTALVGASGSGKSSVLRAGVIPRLRHTDDAGLRPAALRIVTPGAHPLHTHHRLLRAKDTNGERADTWLIVDQFEELYTLCRDPAERTAFIDQLLTAHDPDSRLRVLIAVRADFYGRCLEHEGLTTVLRDAGMPVAPMGPDELREAIIKPAAARGLIVERGLTTRIIEEIDGEPGGLPLMSHALLETWRRRRGKTLTEAAYNATNGLHGAIAHTAEATYTQLPPAQAAIARRTLLRLITPGEGAQDTRRPIDRSELGAGDPADTAAVLERLVSARLITLDGDTIDLAHEALIGAWPRLRGWIEDDRERLRVHRRLTDAAHAWDELGRDPGALYRGIRLTAAEEALTTSDLTTLEQDFFAASGTARDHEQQAATRTTRRLRQFTAALSVLLVLALVAGTAAWDQYRTSEQERRNVLAAQQISLSRQLAAQSAALADDNPDLASLLAVHAYRAAHTKEAAAGVLAAAGLPLRHRLTHTYGALSMAFSPDGRTLASVDGAGGIRLWDVSTGKTRTTLTDNSGAESVAFSPDGRTLASGEDNGGVQLWDVTTGKVRSSLRSPQVDYVKSVVFSPDGRTLAGSGGRGVKVRLWDVATGRLRASLRSHADEVKSVVFSPDGRTLAGSGGKGMKVRLWDVTTGKTRTTLTGSGATRSVAFSPDGRTLATGGDGGRLRLWDVAMGRVRASLRSHADEVNSVAFSPDGRTLASGGEDGNVRLWDTATGKTLTTLTGHTSDVQAVAFSPDRRTLASIGGEDGALRLWDVASGRTRATLTGHTGAVKSLAFSRTGSTLASGSDDGTMRLWDVASGKGRIGFSRNTTVKAVAFSPSGRALAGGSDEEGRAWLWDAATRRVRVLAFSDANHLDKLVFSPDGRTLAGESGSGSVHAWEVTAGTVHATSARPPDPVGSLVFSPDGRTVASNSYEGTMFLWDVKTGTTRTRVTQPGSINGVRPVAFSPDGRTLASGDGTERVRLWDLTAARRSVTLTGPLTPVASVAFSPDGQTLAIGSYDGTVRLWDVKTGRRRAILPGHTGRVGMVLFSPDGRTLASGDDTGGVRLWDVYLPHLADAVNKLCLAVNRELTPAETSFYLPGRIPHDVCRS
ncbi:MULTISPECIES: helix-turn-helix domain-containing protein [unclassified Streptomyces]|uniref:nSTAND1 domain-containing NTPase n=1 Tax=unclassified Streptomyces TaxID=2593676 RepID=UPI0008902C16|nr:MULTISPECIES: helix-turn-helix domain-containing protein [unclassified Streptomyces]PBC80226.1 WD40 repeat protein [Streptomyces sp. 2321.6]SDR59702.1 WD40 repeat [Streptomyces sp. KS_16]SEB66715.1 WD40 repeat [Streptomyces sp. 2133.1]SNC59379.1 WD40 repeat [Streptomyces sp. 2114.4]